MGESQPKRYSFIDDPWGWLDNSYTEFDDNDLDYEAKITTIAAEGVGLTSPASPSQTPPRWRRLPCSNGSPRGRCSHSMTPIGNCCLVLFGGGYIPNNNDSGTASSQHRSQRRVFHNFNDLWLFNGLTSQWKELQIATTTTTTSDQQESVSFPAPRRGHAMQYSQEHDALILFGGITDGDEYLNDLWMLDLKSVCWERLGPAPPVSSSSLGPRSPASSSSHAILDWPTARRGALSFIHKGKFYIFGGETIESGELEIFSLELTLKPQDWKWTKCTVSDRTVEGSPYRGISHLFQASPMPNMMHAPTIFDSANATLNVYGGIVDPGHINRFLHRFHLQEDGTSFHQVCVYARQNQHHQRQQDHNPPNDDDDDDDDDDDNGDDNGDQHHDDRNDESPQPPVARYFHGGCAVEGSASENFIIAGGFGPDGNLSDSHLYNSKTKTWTLLSDGPGPRNGLCVSPLLHGTTSSNVLLFGGGVYPHHYFDETYVLELDKLCTTLKTGANNGANDYERIHFSWPTTNDMDEPASEQHSDDLIDVELVISCRGGNGDDDDPQVVVEMCTVEILSQHSEYFQRMFIGPFLEAQQQQSQPNSIKKQKKVIQLSDVKPRPASICLQYMRLFSNGSSSNIHQSQQNDFQQKLKEMEFDELDSIVLVADMWGMNGFLNVLEDVLYLGLVMNGDETVMKIDDELILFEYAKSHGFHKLAFKCLKRTKRKKQRCVDWNDNSINNNIKWHVGGDNNNIIDQSLVQEVESFLESSLL